MAEAELPLVSVLSLGGTVAMTSGDTSGARPTVDASGLVAAVPQLENRARVRTEAFSSVPGASLRLADLIGFLPRMESLCAEGSSGLVVTTGTDTLEEVAYLFDLAWTREEPVVVTGAMRPADGTSSDGPANLLAAVTVAADPDARRRGCLAVLNDEVHAARTVRKSHTTQLNAFTSSEGCPAGEVHENQVRWRHGTPRRALPFPTTVESVPRVAVLRLTLDQDVELLDHAVATHDGVVVEAFGAGHVPSWWVEALGRAVRQVPVAVTSRTGTGALLRSSYGFPGSEQDLVNVGVHLVDDMDGPKARILLTAALLCSSDRKEVDDIMGIGHPAFIPASDGAAS